MLIADIQIERIKSQPSRSRRRFEPWGQLELHVPLPANIRLKTIDGEARMLGGFAGQALLIVNVASQCGFTPQYTGLEALHRKYKDRGLVVLGFPCNDFGEQEPGSNSEIKTFCSSNYEVTFPMF